MKIGRIDFNKVLSYFSTKRARKTLSPEESLFGKKYYSFKNLLDANNQALDIIADLENIVYQDKPFRIGHVRQQVETLLHRTQALVKSLNALSGNRYRLLENVTKELSEKIYSDLWFKRRFEAGALTLPIERISLENAPEVGGKAANLGEIANRVHLPVPPGFAVTAYAYYLFMEHNRLFEVIDKGLDDLDIQNTEALEASCREIRNKIIEAALPTELENDMLEAAYDLQKKTGTRVKMAVRSSATSEDSEASFAGQHTTVLNVSTDNLGLAYKEVVASTFNPRAVYYRRSRGYREQDVNMSVACVTMIDAEISGVLYTVDPNDSRNAVVLISAVWGLAADAVEGSVASDFFQVDKITGKVTMTHIAKKIIRLTLASGDGIEETPLPEDAREKPCLDEDRIHRLLTSAERLERHYGYALDIEWVFDKTGRLFILQARPLRRSRRYGIESVDEKPSMVPDRETQAFDIILKSGQSACDGCAFGFAYVIESDHTLHHIPNGAVVVARQTSPRYVPLMGRIRAFITDVGSVTGHMASVAREFQIPTLVGTGNATSRIQTGEEITLDAAGCIVYRGRVDALLTEKRKLNPMKDSPVHKAVKTMLKRVAPLNLTDPKKSNFRPESCQTVHDIIRFAHEMSMQEMFRITASVSPDDALAIPIRVYLPIKLFAVDLGNGLRKELTGNYAELEDITSIPFTALLKGMKHKKVDWTRDVGVDWRGFTSILAESVLRDPMKEGRMGEPAYAVIAGHYLNFNSRLGYHFTTIDTFCGPNINDNYILFSFKGGAADIGRRIRRARMIGMILKKLGFSVEVKGDRVRGEIKKYREPVLCEKLDTLGRLLGSVRLLDMVLSEDRQVEWYVDQFMAGNYTFVHENAHGSPDSTRDRMLKDRE